MGVFKQAQVELQDVQLQASQTKTKIMLSFPSDRSEELTTALTELEILLKRKWELETQFKQEIVSE